MLFEDKYLQNYCAFDNFLLAFTERVIADSVRKFEAAREEPEEIKKNVIARNPVTA